MQAAVRNGVLVLALFLCICGLAGALQTGGMSGSAASLGKGANTAKGSQEAAFVTSVDALPRRSVRASVCDMKVCLCLECSCLRMPATHALTTTILLLVDAASARGRDQQAS